MKGEKKTHFDEKKKHTKKYFSRQKNTTVKKMHKKHFVFKKHLQ